MADSSDPGPRLLAGRFERIDVLGEGGMGIVYRVRDVRTGEVLALKTMHRDEPDALVRFKSEFRAIADIHHPNLVRLGEMVEADGQMFFTMEYVDGVDFVTHVRGGPGGFDEVRLRGAMRQLAEALHTVHAHHRVHRDVKPNNVLVTPEGRVVLLDFGLSVRTVQGHQRSDIIAAGTAAYMAPEQAASRPVGPRADWYSVGVLLFETLTGELPFRGSAVEVLTHKLEGEAPSPDQRVADLPPDLSALCHDLLRRDPRERPRGTEILRRLSASRARTAPPDAAGARFVGRRAGFAALVAAFDAARRGAVLQMVVAESGIGKTALVDELAHRLERAHTDVLVLAGRCHERESIAFKAFDGVVDALGRRLLQMSPALLDAVLPRHVGLLGLLFPSLCRVRAIAEATAATSTPTDLRSARERAIQVFRELLARLADRTRLVVVIDDFHRADQDSLDLLASLLGGIDPPRALVVLTARPSPVVDMLRDLAARGRSIAPRVLELAPLPPVDATALARQALARRGASTDTQLEQLIGEAEGHPRFLVELARAAPSASETGKRRSLDDLVWSRIATLSAIERDLLGVLAVAGGPLTVAQAAAALELDDPALLRHLDALSDADLATTTGRWADAWIDLYHDRIGETIRRHADAADHERWHARLAESLERAGASPERVLVHAQASGHQAEVGRLALEAARAAAAAFELHRARRLYRLALAELPAQRDEVLPALADVVANAGDAEEAAQLYLDAAVTAPAPARADLQRRAADQLLLAGQVGRSPQLLGEVLAQVGVPPPPASRAAMIARLAWARALLQNRLRRPKRRIASELDRARLDVFWSAGRGLGQGSFEYQARYLTLALEIGDASRQCRGLALDATYAAMRGAARRREVDALLSRARDLAEETDQAIDRGWVALGRAFAEILAGNFAQAVTPADRAHEWFTARPIGAIWEQRNARVLGIWARYFTGDLGEFARRTRIAMREADAHRDRYTLALLRGGVGNSIWLMDDDPASALDEADAVSRDWPAATFQAPSYYRMVALGQADLYAGEAERGYRRLLDTWPALEQSMLLRIEFFEVNGQFLRGRLAIAAGELDDARRAASRLRKSAASWGRRLARLLDAAVAAGRGDRDAARAELERASDELDAHPLPMHAAAARRALATFGAGGAQRADADERRLADAGVRRPDRWLAMLAPGFTPAPAAP